MKNLVMLLAVPMFVVVCNGGGERPLVATCMPAVSVVVPRERKARPTGTTAVAPVARREAVQVYWDVSKSMLDFAAAGNARGGVSEPMGARVWTDDLTPVVAALDSGVLLSAHAKTVEQYGVGESIQLLTSARAALHPTANRTVLHLAAEQIGTALASGSTQAALIVSDLELDTPARTSASDGTVCRGVPLPSTREAGSLFGRCFENAVLASDSRITRTNLLVHVFRKSTHGRELFILLLASDRPFGRRISDEIVRRLDFSRHVIFDSGAVAAANVRGCTLLAPASTVYPRIVDGRCGAKCFDRDATIQAECDVRRSAKDAWIYEAGRGVNGVTYESLSAKAGDPEAHARVRFPIPCDTPPGRFQAAVSFTWREHSPWSQDSNSTFARKASVRDLFDSLTDAIVRTVAQRRVLIGIDLAK
jgi:hypothetical protein